MVVVIEALHDREGPRYLGACADEVAALAWVAEWIDDGDPVQSDLPPFKRGTHKLTIFPPDEGLHMLGASNEMASEMMPTSLREVAIDLGMDGPVVGVVGLNIWLIGFAR